MSDSQDTAPLARIERQLERMELDLRNTATRSDLAELRKEVVQQAVLEPQLLYLRSEIAQIKADRADDKKAFEKRLEDMEKDQASRQERLWMRISPVVAIIALILSFLQYFSHIQLK